MPLLRVAWLIPVLAFTTHCMAAQMPGLAPVPAQPSAAADSSDQPTPTIHVTSRLVVLDVVVTDSDGKPAHGLKPSDFTLFEDGVPQKLASFTEHDAAGPTGPASPLPTNVFTVQPPPAEGQTKTIIVLADRTSWPINYDKPQFPSLTAVNTGYVRNDIAAFLKNAPSTQPVAIVRLDWEGMHLVQGLTTDRGVLTEAIASKRMEPPLGFVVRFAHAPGSPNRQLVRYVQSIPGRVNLVWITYGGVVPAAEVAEDFPDLSNLVRELNGPSNVLHLSRVALYPIPLSQQDVWANEALIEAANATGGYAYFTGITQALTEIAATGSDYYTISYVPTNPNWNGAFRKIKIGIEGFPQPPPPETWSSTWSQLLGWTEGHKSKVLYRPGYLARTKPSPAEELVREIQGSNRPPDPARKLLSYSPKGDPAGYNATNSSLLQRAMQFGSLPLDGVNFTFTATPAPATNQLAPGAPLPDHNFLTEPFREDAYRNVQLHYWIDPQNLAFSRDAYGSLSDDLKFVAVVYRDDGIPANSIASTEDIRVSADSFEDPSNPGVTFDQTIAIPVSGNPVPGNFFLRVAIEERSTGHIGAIEIPTEEIQIALPTQAAR